MGKYFGTDGFRGKAGENLNAAHAFKIGRYLGSYFDKNKRTPERAKILIGKDPRRSSYMFENAIAAGITSSGADAYLMHITTTPSVSFLTKNENFACGVMVSASHNPYYDNGIKLINSEGEKMNDSFIDELEKYLDSETDVIPYATEDKIGKTEDYYFGRNRYIGYLSAIAEKSLENCKIGIDCSNGSTWMIGRSVFDALGAKTYVINNSPNGLNINKDCGSTHIEALRRHVVENKLDCGFAFDGDGDRCIAVDEDGNVVDGDKIIYVCANYLKEKGELKDNTVVVTVMSNIGLLKGLEKKDIKYEITPVGDRFVYEEMKRGGFSVGGEQSGHIIFSKYSHTGDGILTAVMLMNVMIKTQLPLSILTAGCKSYPQVLKNVVVDNKEITLKDPAVLEAVSKAEKILGSSGRILLRASGTEPVLRVMSEASTNTEAHKAVDNIIAAMASSGHLLEIRK